VSSAEFSRPGAGNSQNNIDHQLAVAPRSRLAAETRRLGIAGHGVGLCLEGNPEDWGGPPPGIGDALYVLQWEPQLWLSP
jgi:hypothetical protein